MQRTPLIDPIYPWNVCKSFPIRQDIVGKRVSPLFHPRFPFVNPRLFLPGCVALMQLLGSSSTPAADSVLVFNEIHYHPADEINDTEWIELHNLHGVDVDISGWQLRGGVEFDFAEGTVVPGHGFVVIAANPGHPRLAGLGALGPLQGKLANNGETLRLENRNGRVMDRLSYRDDGEWPSGPDG